MTVTVYDYADTVHEDSPTVLDSGAFVYQALAGSVSTNPKGQLAQNLHSSVQTTFYNGWYSPGDQQHNQIRCQSILWWGGQPHSWYSPAPGTTKWHGVRTLIHTPWTPSVAWYSHLTWHGAGADPKLPIGVGMYDVAWARSAFGGPTGQLLNDSAIPAGCTNGYFLTVTGGEYPWVTTPGPGYYNQRVWFVAPVAPGKPETFFVGVRYATDGKTGSSTGWVEVWHDNQKVVRDVGPNLFKHQDGSISQPYYLAENYHGNINGTDTVEYSGLVVADTVAELQAFFYPSPLLHAESALWDLRASSAYESLQSSAGWTTTKLYACEQELLATIKALS